ncbi:MAG: peptidylprolyl isomerase [Verrucomicrobiales bacterium]|nr:peptidylprolyl isomerase [Verrucomicrobiales bacterium]
MFGTIRKHQTWLWALIIGATIVSFVIFFTPTGSRGGQGGVRVNYGTMNGRPITLAERRQAQREAELSFFLRTGQFPDRASARQAGFDIDQETRSRLVLLAQVDELGIVVDDAAVADWVLRYFGGAEQPDAARAAYTQVLQMVRRSGISEREFNDFIRHQIALGHLQDVASVGGRLVTPREAAAEYREQNKKLEVEAVVLVSTNFLSQVQVPADELAQFYTNRQSAYRIPERVSVHYLRFAATNYLAQAEEALNGRTNLATQLDELYRTRGANSFMDTNGQVMTPEAAKLKLREDLQQEESLLVARREASRFGAELDRIDPLTAEGLLNLAAAKGLTTRDTEPFAESDLSVVPGAGGRFNQAAFRLTAEAPVSASVVGQDGVYLLALKDRLPSEVEPLDAVRARVMFDFTRDRARRLAVEAGDQLAASLKAAVAGGKTFAEAVVDAGQTLVSLPRFTPSSTSLPGWDRRLQLREVQARAASMKTGEISDFMQTATGGFVLHVKDRQPVEEAELQEALPDYLKQLQQSGGMAFFRDWMSRRAELADVRFGNEEQSAAGEPQAAQ